LKLNAKSYLPKNIDFEILIDAIFQVNSGLYYLNKNVSQTIVNSLRISSESIPKTKIKLLNEKEIEVIRLVCNGLKNNQIGEQMCLSTRTIEGIRQQISKKTNTKNAVELVYFAIKNQIHHI
jgi:DNA-binding NarL/FixJ family response regulator